MISLFSKKKNLNTEKFQKLKIEQTYSRKHDYADRFCNPIFSTITAIENINSTIIVFYKTNYGAVLNCSHHDFIENHNI